MKKDTYEHPAAFRAAVALAACRGDQDAAAVADRFGVSTEQVERWQATLLAGAESLFRAESQPPAPRDEMLRSADLALIIAENSTQGLAMMDERGYCVYANRAWLGMTGYSAEEIGARPLHDLVHHHYPDGRPFPMCECPIDRALPENFELRAHEDLFFRKDGTAFNVKCAASPVFRDGRPVATVIEIRDVTQSKRTQRELDYHRSRLNRIFETDLFGVIYWKLDGAITDCNDEFLRIAGYARADLQAGTIDWIRMTPPEYRVADARAVDELVHTGRHALLEKEYLRKDGSRIWVSVASAMLDDQSGVGVVIDISRAKQAEAALSASEEKFRTLADNIPQLAWMADRAGEPFWYNRRWYDYTGTSAASRTPAAWQAFHHPDHAAAAAEKYRSHIARGAVWEDTFPLRGGDGTYRWFLSRATPIRNDGGDIVCWFGTNTDITMQREITDALREADRRKDEFIAMLAHELRNPLAPIRAALDLFELLAPQEPRLRHAAEVMGRQVSHMTTLISDLLDVARIARGKTELHLACCDLARIVEQSVEDHRQAIEAGGARLRVSLPGAPLRMQGDATRLGQIIGNLLHNAVKFTSAGDQIEVRLDTAVTPAGDVATITVRDTGQGIAPQLLPCLFEPFIQASQGLGRSDGGLGLGLAIVKGLAELHGGSVAARSDGIGCGAAFIVTLPVVAPSADAQQADAEDGIERPLKIALIDDNRDLAHTFREALALQGHDVVVAHDGQSGLRIAQQARPDIVVCDIGLPDTDGYAVARALRGLPELSGAVLIALSGYGQESDKAKTREAGFACHLTKPVSLTDLYAAIDRSVREREAAPLD